MTAHPIPGPAPAADSPIGVLLATLDLEQLDRDLFRGASPPTRLQRIFGGQVAGQALVAAQRTVPDMAVHSLHAYFLRPGAIETPIVYEVDRIRDGRSYSTRRVVGIQHGRAIFNLQASFHVGEEGHTHQVPMPGVEVDPGDLPPFVLPWNDREELAEEPGLPWPGTPFELRVAPPADGYDRLLWLRTTEPIADDESLHRCVAAYASDLTLVSVVLPAGYRGRPPFMASLDHAMWFHRPLRVDEWVLYGQSSPAAGGGRGLAQGRMWTRDGRLAVSVVQEGAVRL